MKNAVKVLGIAICLLTLMGSCKKCYECTKNGTVGSTDETVCDYPGEASQRAENLENDGYSCTAVN